MQDIHTVAMHAWFNKQDRSLLNSLEEAGVKIPEQKKDEHASDYTERFMGEMIDQMMTDFGFTERERKFGLSIYDFWRYPVTLPWRQGRDQRYNLTNDDEATSRIRKLSQDTGIPVSAWIKIGYVFAAATRFSDGRGLWGGKFEQGVWFSSINLETDGFMGLAKLSREDPFLGIKDRGLREFSQALHQVRWRKQELLYQQEGRHREKLQPLVGVQGNLNLEGMVLVHASKGLGWDGKRVALFPNSYFGKEHPIERLPRSIVEFSLNGLIASWNPADVIILTPFSAVPKANFANLWHTATSHVGPFELPIGSWILIRRGSSVEINDAMKTWLVQRKIQVVYFDETLGAQEAVAQSLLARGFTPMTVNNDIMDAFGGTTWLDEYRGLDLMDPAHLAWVQAQLEGLASALGIPWAAKTNGYPLGELSYEMEQFSNQFNGKAGGRHNSYVLEGSLQHLYELINSIPIEIAQRYSQEEWGRIKAYLEAFKIIFDFQEKLKLSNGPYVYDVLTGQNLNEINPNVASKFIEFVNSYAGLDLKAEEMRKPEDYKKIVMKVLDKKMPDFSKVVSTLPSQGNASRSEARSIGQDLIENLRTALNDALLRERNEDIEIAQRIERSRLWSIILAAGMPATTKLKLISDQREQLANEIIGWSAMSTATVEQPLKRLLALIDVNGSLLLPEEIPNSLHTEDKTWESVLREFPNIYNREVLSLSGTARTDKSKELWSDINRIRTAIVEGLKPDDVIAVFDISETGEETVQVRWRVISNQSPAIDLLPINETDNPDGEIITYRYKEMQDEIASYEPLKKNRLSRIVKIFRSESRAETRMPGTQPVVRSEARTPIVSVADLQLLTSEIRPLIVEDEAWSVDLLDKIIDLISRCQTARTNSQSVPGTFDRLLSRLVTKRDLVANALNLDPKNAQNVLEYVAVNGLKDYSVLKARLQLPQNEPILAKFMAAMTEVGRNDLAKFFYQRLREVFADKPQELRPYIRGESFEVHKRVESKRNDNVSLRLQRGRALIDQNPGIPWGQTMDLAVVFQKHGVTDISQMADLAAVYFKDYFGINLDVMLEGEPVEMIDGDQNVPKPITPAQVGKLQSRLVDWARTLMIFDYAFIALNNNMGGLSVASEGRATHGTQQNHFDRRRYMYLYLNSDATVLLHEFGHAIDPLLIPLNLKADDVIDIFDHVDLAEVKKFVDFHEYELPKGIDIQDPDIRLKTLAAVTSRIFERRRESWKFLYRDAGYYDESPNKAKLGFWNGFITDLEEEKHLLLERLSKVNQRAIVNYADLAEVYAEVIEDIKAGLRSGKYKDGQISERQEKIRNLRDAVTAALDRLPAVSTFAGVNQHYQNYKFQVPPNDAQDRLPENTFLGSLRPSHPEYFAECVRLFFAYPDDFREVDMEGYQWMKIMLAGSVDPALKNYFLPGESTIFWSGGSAGMLSGYSRNRSNGLEKRQETRFEASPEPAHTGTRYSQTPGTEVGATGRSEMRDKATAKVHFEGDAAGVKIYKTLNVAQKSEIEQRLGVSFDAERSGQVLIEKIGDASQKDIFKVTLGSAGASKSFVIYAPLEGEKLDEEDILGELSHASRDIVRFGGQFEVNWRGQSEKIVAAEYLSGKTLETVIREQGISLDEREALEREAVRAFIETWRETGGLKGEGGLFITDISLFSSQVTVEPDVNGRVHIKGQPYSIKIHAVGGAKRMNDPAAILRLFRSVFDYQRETKYWAWTFREDPFGFFEAIKDALGTFEGNEFLKTALSIFLKTASTDATAERISKAIERYFQVEKNHEMWPEKILESLNLTLLTVLKKQGYVVLHAFDSEGKLERIYAVKETGQGADWRRLEVSIEAGEKVIVVSQKVRGQKLEDMRQTQVSVEPRSVRYRRDDLSGVSKGYIFGTKTGVFPLREIRVDPATNKFYLVFAHDFFDELCSHAVAEKNTAAVFSEGQYVDYEDLPMVFTKHSTEPWFAKLALVWSHSKPELVDPKVGEDSRVHLYGEDVTSLDQDSAALFFATINDMIDDELFVQSAESILRDLRRKNPDKSYRYHAINRWAAAVRLANLLTGQIERQTKISLRNMTSWEQIPKSYRGLAQSLFMDFQADMRNIEDAYAVNSRDFSAESLSPEELERERSTFQQGYAAYQKTARHVQTIAPRSEMRQRNNFLSDPEWLREHNKAMPTVEKNPRLGGFLLDSEGKLRPIEGSSRTWLPKECMLMRFVGEKAGDPDIYSGSVIPLPFETDATGSKVPALYYEEASKVRRMSLAEIKDQFGLEPVKDAGQVLTVEGFVRDSNATTARVLTVPGPFTVYFDAKNNLIRTMKDLENVNAVVTQTVKVKFPGLDPASGKDYADALIAALVNAGAIEARLSVALEFKGIGSVLKAETLRNPETYRDVNGKFVVIINSPVFKEGFGVAHFEDALAGETQQAILPLGIETNDRHLSSFSLEKVNRSFVTSRFVFGSGTSLRLNDLRRKVLLDFWAARHPGQEIEEDAIVEAYLRDLAGRLGRDAGRALAHGYNVALGGNDWDNYGFFGELADMGTLKKFRTAQGDKELTGRPRNDPNPSYLDQVRTILIEAAKVFAKTREETFHDNKTGLLHRPGGLMEIFDQALKKARSETRSEARGTVTAEMWRDFSEAVEALLTPRIRQWVKTEHVARSADSLETLLGGIMLPADAIKLGAERVANILTVYVKSHDKATGQFNMEVFLEAIKDLMAKNPAFKVSGTHARTVKVLDRLPGSAELAGLAIQLAMNTGQEFPYVFSDEVKKEPGWASFKESVKKIKAMKDTQDVPMPIGERLSIKTVKPSKMAAEAITKSTAGLEATAGLLGSHSIILWGASTMPKNFESLCTVVRLLDAGDKELASAQNLAGMKGAQTGLKPKVMPEELKKELPEVFQVKGNDPYYTMNNENLREFASILSEIVAKAAVLVAA